MNCVSPFVLRPLRPPAQKRVPMPLVYRARKLSAHYEIDLLVGGTLIVVPVFKDGVRRVVLPGPADHRRPDDDLA